MLTAKLNKAIESTFVEPAVATTADPWKHTRSAECTTIARYRRAISNEWFAFPIRVRVSSATVLITLKLSRRLKCIHITTIAPPAMDIPRENVTCLRIMSRDLFRPCANVSNTSGPKNSILSPLKRYLNILPSSRCVFISAQDDVASLWICCPNDEIRRGLMRPSDCVLNHGHKLAKLQTRLEFSLSQSVLFQLQITSKAINA